MRRLGRSRQEEDENNKACDYLPHSTPPKLCNEVVQQAGKTFQPEGGLQPQWR